MNLKKIKKILLITTLAVLFGVSGTAKNEVIPCTWATTPVQIDGSSVDWTQAALIHQKKTDTDLAFQNDGKYLYVLFEFNNPKYLSSINGSGMMMYFAAGNKKSKDYGIRFFTKQVSVDEFISLYEKQRGSLTEDQKNELRKNKFYIVFRCQIKNKGDKEEKDAVSREGILPAVFRVKSQQKKIVYEFAVPLARPEPYTAGVGTDPGNAVKVGFQWGGWTREMKRNAADRLAASGSRARASRAVGLESERGGASSGTPPLSSMRRRKPKEYNFWVDIQLAKQ